MGKCKAGPWCMGCKKAREIENEKIFEDYRARLSYSSYYTLYTAGGLFASGYICKKAIEEICEGLEEKGELK